MIERIENAKAVKLEIQCQKCNTVYRIDEDDWSYEKWCKYPYKQYEDADKGYFNRYIVCPNCRDKIYDRRNVSSGRSIRLIDIS